MRIYYERKGLTCSSLPKTEVHYHGIERLEIDVLEKKNKNHTLPIFLSHYHPFPYSVTSCHLYSSSCLAPFLQKTNFNSSAFLIYVFYLFFLPLSILCPLLLFSVSHLYIPCGTAFGFQAPESVWS